MNPTMCSVSRIVMLLMLLVISSEICVVKVESKVELCKKKSETKTGVCFSSASCTMSCVKEKALKGECHGFFFFRRCYCYKFCSGDSPQ
ncbi:hypothetical protein ABFS82_05G045800 [Erythranthe guttata]